MGRRGGRVGLGCAVLLVFWPLVSEARVTFRAGSIVSDVVAPDAGPQAMALADVDGDGAADLIVVSPEEGVAVFQNDGGGNFRPLPNSPFDADSPVAVVVADVNGDGRADIIVANQFAGTVSVLLQSVIDGEIDFAVDETVEEDPQVDPGPVGIVLGRFDADTVADLAVLSDSSLHLLHGTESGRYADFATASVSLGPGVTGGFAIASGDFNGDGHLDLAASARTANRVGVLLGNGDGTFQSSRLFRPGDDPRGLVVGDFRGAAFDDIAVVTGIDIDAIVSIMAGAADGSFTTENTDFSEVDSLAIAKLDLDGDAKQDLVVTNVAGGVGVTVFCRQPSTTCYEPGSDVIPAPIILPDEDGFQVQLLSNAFGGNATAVVAGDVNGDSRPDVLTLAEDGDSVRVVLNNGSAEIPTPTARATATLVRPPTATPTPESVASMLVSSAIGRPGDGVEITVSLANSRHDVVATATQILLDYRVIGADLLGTSPATPTPVPCRVNPAIHRSLIFSFEYADVYPYQRGSFFVVPNGNNDPIPDGPLFTCKLAITRSAFPGEYPIYHTMAGVYGADGGDLGYVARADGQLTVTLVLPTSSPTSVSKGGDGCSISKTGASTSAALWLVPILVGMWRRNRDAPTCLEMVESNQAD